MYDNAVPRNRRVLVIDDNKDIHRDFNKILVRNFASGRENQAVEQLESILFGEEKPTEKRKGFLLDSAYQGQEGLACVHNALAQNKPYAMTFLDVRMPPGWDGIETAEHLWQADPELLIVICTAYSDYSWEKMIARLGITDRLVILKKPFDAVEVLQLAEALTEKWRLAREARLKLEELEQLVAERTESLQKEIQWRKKTEKELHISRDEAQAANRAKSQFLANMSHEIRTPMNGIFGMCQLLADAKDLPADLAELVSTLYSSGEVLLALINDILDFSKIEANKLILETAPFSLDELLGDTVQLFTSQINEKKIELISEVDLDTGIYYNGDAIRIRQILQNLLSNAVKFTAEGEVSIKVSSEPIGENLRKVKIIVQDTGIGISKEHQESLFEPFTQADSSITRRFGGTGLGLAICKRLVKLMDGEILLQSQLGEGTTFTIMIPLETATAHNQSLSSRQSNGSLGGIRTLIVDDNKTNRDFLGRLLKQWSMPCEETSSAKLALEMIQSAASNNCPFQLILIDYHMPDVDGMSLAVSIKATLKDKTPPILLLTSHFERPGKQELENAGIIATLFKPLRKATLFDTVLKALNIAEEKKLPTTANSADEKDVIPQFSKMQILIAEDNPVNQRVALLLLKRYGCEATAVNNGQQALDLIKTQTFDLIFMDCQMPVLDGFEATLKIRQYEKEIGKGYTPIIAMTAGGINLYRQKCVDVGMDDFIAKPVHQKRLVEVILRIQKKFLHQPNEQRTIT